MSPVHIFTSQSKFFRKKQTPRTSSHYKWSNGDDSALLAAVRNARTINWIHISEVAFPEKSRSGLACQVRWTKQLNPALVVSEITATEQESIISGFNTYGFQFYSYSPNRSPYQLKTFLYRHVCGNHRNDGGVCLFLFEKLQPLFETKADVLVGEWIERSITNRNHFQCYKMIVGNNIKFFFNWFGIEIKNSSCCIAKEGWYQRSRSQRKHKIVEVTPEERMYLASLIDEMKSVDRVAVPASFKVLQII